jgi:hypothetical protein
MEYVVSYIGHKYFQKSANCVAMLKQTYSWDGEEKKCVGCVRVEQFGK